MGEVQSGILLCGYDESSKASIFVYVKDDLSLRYCKINAKIKNLKCFDYKIIFESYEWIRIHDIASFLLYME